MNWIIIDLFNTCNIINNSINTNGTLGVGIILLANSDLNNIINNSITTSGGGAGAFWVDSSSGSNITGNNINENKNQIK